MESEEDVALKLVKASKVFSCAVYLLQVIINTAFGDIRKFYARLMNQQLKNDAIIF